MDHAFLGPSYREDEIEQFLRWSKLPYRRLADVAEETADLLVQRGRPGDGRVRHRQWLLPPRRRPPGGAALALLRRRRGTAGGAGGAAGGLAWLALGGAGLWLMLTARFCARRLRGTSHAPAQVAEMAVTSALIPLLSVYWRLRGALRFRVFFL
jgi:hypothetical protein